MRVKDGQRPHWMGQLLVVFFLAWVLGSCSQVHPVVAIAPGAYDTAETMSRDYLTCFDKEEVTGIVAMLRRRESLFRKGRYQIYPSRFNNDEQCAGLYYLETVQGEKKLRIPLLFDGDEVRLNAAYCEGLGTTSQVQVALSSANQITSTFVQWYDTETLKQMVDSYGVGVTTEPLNRIYHK